MSEQAGLIDYVVTVKANSFEKVITHGTGFYVASPDNAKIEIETPDGGRFDCGVGEGAKHLNPFSYLVVRNYENYDQQIKLKIGYGEFMASAGGGGGSVGSMVALDEISGGGFGMAVGSHLEIAANESRLSVCLQGINQSTISGVLFFSANGKTVGAVELGVGDSFVFDFPINSGFRVDASGAAGFSAIVFGFQVVK